MTRQPDTDTMELENIPLDTIPRPPDGHMVRATLSCPQPDTTVCTVTGRVDLVTAQILTDTLTEAVHDDRLHLVIDLSAAALLDSAGLQAVFEALDRYDIDGHVAVVVDSNSEAITSPEITALDEFLDRHDDLSSALQACARASISTPGRHRAKVMDRHRALRGGSVD
ncbi:MAG: STAS domain-containing protein [Pseudonocardiaceae bacterium]